MAYNRNLGAKILFFWPLLLPIDSCPAAQTMAPAGSAPAKQELLQGHCKCCSKPRAPAGKRKHPTAFLPRNPSPCNCGVQRCSLLGFSFQCLSIIGRPRLRKIQERGLWYGIQHRLEWYGPSWPLQLISTYPETDPRAWPNTSLELPFGFKDLWIQKKSKINTKIKRTTEPQLVSIALPLADLTESNTQEPNPLSSEYNSSASKPAFRCTNGSFMHCKRQHPLSVLLLELS